MPTIPHAPAAAPTDAPTGAPTGAEEVHWDLGDLYAGLDDPALETDLTRPLVDAQAFATTYRGRVAQLDAGELAAACRELEALWTPLYRASAYAHLRFAVDTADPAIGALVARSEEQAATANTATLFFELEWNAVEDERAEALLADALLDGYRHHLETLRRHRPHQLSEAEERILSELAPTGASAWSRLFSQLTGALRVDVDGQTRTLDEALGGLYEPDREARRTAHEAITAALDADLPTRAFILNTLLADKATKDRLRSHPHWLHSRNLANEADDAQVAALVEAVTGRYDLVARYYRTKARLLGLSELADYDRYAPTVADDEVRVGWSDARTLVLDAYAEFHPQLARLASEFFERSWIDAAVAPGKRGGAFAHSVTPDIHPYVFLNFTGRARDAMTLAHELGHGVHMRLSQRQTLFNADTPLTTAETASIFGETLTFARLLDAAGDDPAARLALYTRRLEDAFASIFRQVAMNRFEDAIHTARRHGGELSPDEVGDHWIATQHAMFGDAVTLTEGYRSWWSYVPHFIGTPGYVYAYAYGNLLALALFRRFTERGRDFADAYLELMAMGGSLAPNDLLARVDVDLGDPAFWASGLAVLEDEVAEAERLATEVSGP
jgi:oligoendopeptidase F